MVLGANPCPCGDYSSDPAADRCTCGEVRRRGYREKFSAPVKDRIDIERHVKVGLGRDYTIYALVEGTVKFQPYSRDQKMVSVIPAELPVETAAAAD